MTIALSIDATDLKHADAISNQMSAVSVRPVAYGKETGAAAVRQLMHNCSSCLRMWTLRWLRGNDHTPNLIKEFLPFLRGCYRFKDGQTLVVPHMLLACAPIEYDHLFRIVAVHRVGTKTHPNYYDERFQCWSNVEIEIEPVVTGDMSMLTCT